MTGRDVPTRQKALSVAFSAIMVLSVIGMGMAGSAGAVVTDSDVAFGSDTYDNDFEPGNLEVLLIDDSGVIQDSFSANTTSQTINRTNASNNDIQVGNLTASLNNTGMVV